MCDTSFANIKRILQVKDYMNLIRVALKGLNKSNGAKVQDIYKYLISIYHIQVRLPLRLPLCLVLFYVKCIHLS